MQIERKKTRYTDKLTIRNTKMSVQILPSIHVSVHKIFSMFYPILTMLLSFKKS